MAQIHQRSSLLPPGLIMERLRVSPGEIVILARSRQLWAACPACGRRSGQVHSHYERRLLDVPAHGRQVRIQLDVRRFRCGRPGCLRQIFAERVGGAVVQPFARRTARLQDLLHALGLALGGRPGERLAERLLIAVSRDTLLRLIRALAPASAAAPRVIGIDDWAWKRGHRYGTIVCDLERHCIVDVLPDREAATVAARLGAHPEVDIVSRDRGGGYGQAVTAARPEVVQVADRWHLLENASRAFLDAVRRSMSPIRRALSAGRIKPALLTSAERIQ
ncbi:transposase [Rubellimicrobium aerolatum]|nr:transposase [Rubellimicrobium aerolatum]